MWTAAHYPEEKSVAISEEKQARIQLRESLREWSTEEELKWLDIDFLSSSATPAYYDIRQLFPSPEKGWDIVVGNPPYQKPDTPSRYQGLGYVGAKENMYLMFIEAALKVAGDGGCVTLVVPHSITFGLNKTFSSIRRNIEDASERIELRTYDNMPQPLFPPLPWLKDAEHGKQNRQRATVLTFLKKRKHAESASAKKGTVVSSGLMRLSASTRKSVLRRTGTRQPQPLFLTTQWIQAPTSELADLLKVMREASGSVEPAKHAGTRVITFPPTAMYFISCLPEDRLDNRRRKAYRIADDKYFWPWVGLYNSNLFHAYWLMTGDAFHVTQAVYGSIRAPVGWADEQLRQATERTARQLMKKQTLQSCHVVKKNHGEQRNIHFHKEGTLGPPIIDELDRLLLQAYELDTYPLVDQMRTIRIGSAHLLAN